MENKKILLIFLIALLSCSLFNVERDGWYYLRKNDVNRAHKEFLRDFAYENDNVVHSSGLSYTYFLFNEKDSAMHYMELSECIDINSSYMLFVSLNNSFFYNNINKADTVYRRFFDSYQYSINGFIVDSVIEYKTMHKMGLSANYQLAEYEFVYDILSRITDIPYIDLSDENERKILLDYIEKL